MDFRLHDQDILISKCPVKRPALERRIKHYSNSHQILLVGEGDFSFSLALASAFGSADNMVATSLDSRKRIISSYESGQNNLHNLEQRGAKILHGVDVTTMSKLEIMKQRLFDRIVYNFPHAGFFGKEEDHEQIRMHRHLLKMFIKNGMSMLNKKGEIHVTHKENHPYDKWNLVEQAEECGLVLKESVYFNKADYPGYTNRRGAGPDIGNTFFLGECKTYMFISRKFMTKTTTLPKLSSQGHPKSLKAAILELETERQNRKAAETAKANLEFSFNELKTVIDEALKERDAFRRQKDEALRDKAKITKQLAQAKAAETAKANLEFSFNEMKTVKDKALKERDAFRMQKDEALQENAKITRQLAQALRLKEDATKQNDLTVLELELERKARKDAESARENMEVLLNHRKAAETAKTNLEFSFNEMKTVKDKASKERDAFRMQKDEALQENAKITKQLAQALRLKEDATKQKDATVLELEFERKARKDAESARENMEGLLNHYKASVYYLELKKTNQLERQRDEALHQKEAACREKEKIAKQLDETMRSKDEATNEKERILREPNYLDNQETKVNKQLVAEALRLKEEAVKQRDATILELEFERKARKYSESSRANIESSQNHHKASVYNWELEKMNQLGKQRDDALNKKELDWMKKEKIAKQISEPFILKQETIVEKEMILSEPNELANQMEEITYWNLFRSYCFRH